MASRTSELNGPNPGSQPESKRDKKRREWVDKVEAKHKERMDDRDRMYIDTHQSLSHLASSLLPLPPTSQSYLLSLYLLTLERDALLSQVEMHHEYRLESSRRLFELEKDRLEEEYRKAKEGAKNLLLDKVEERRKRLREEKDGGDGSDLHSFSPLPPLNSASSAGHHSSAANRKLRPSRHQHASALDSALHLPFTSLPLSGSSAVNGTSSSSSSSAPGTNSAGFSILTDEILAPPAHLSLSILSHPSLSKTSSSANIFNSSLGNAGHPTGSSSSGSSKKARNSSNSNNHNSNGFANGHPDGSGNGQNPTLPGNGMFDKTPPSFTSSTGSSLGGGITEQIYNYVPGKSLADLGKLVKTSEAEVDWDLDQIRRSWKGGVLAPNGRGRRGAAVRADAGWR
ncbi:Sds3-like [Phaffia rhodozyma]|uniref:Sds3-like n=1 Tax=Phaffia rhodozyma TaxID=264483 RepID=A0A0F7SI50_PHARH|nr:Sds3-like [Phaffia rhodozyma]